MIIELVMLAGGYLLFRYGLTSNRGALKYTGLILMGLFALFTVTVWVLAVNQGMTVERIAKAFRFPLVLLAIIVVDYVRLRDKRRNPD